MRVNASGDSKGPHRRGLDPGRPIFGEDHDAYGHSRPGTLIRSTEHIRQGLPAWARSASPGDVQETMLHGRHPSIAGQSAPALDRLGSTVAVRPVLPCSWGACAGIAASGHPRNGMAGDA